MLKKNIKDEDKRNVTILREATIKKMVEKYHISVKQATRLFDKSKLNEDLFSNPANYRLSMPSDLLDMWVNERLFGYPISTDDILAGALKDAILD